jgi:hypothetical protein
MIPLNKVRENLKLRPVITGHDSVDHLKNSESRECNYFHSKFSYSMIQMIQRPRSLKTFGLLQSHRSGAATRVSFTRPTGSYLPLDHCRSSIPLSIRRVGS